MTPGLLLDEAIARCLADGRLMTGRQYLALAAARLVTAEHGGDRKSELIKSSNEDLILYTRDRVSELMGVSKAAIARVSRGRT
jgi:hypothetical protein